MYIHFVRSSMKFLIIALVVTAAVAAPPRSHVTTLMDLFSKGGHFENRIISGQSAQAGQFPWQAAIHFTTSEGDMFCGGALISPQWVLTAGHCTAGASSFLISVGGVTLDASENGRVDVKTSTKIVHQNYNPDNLNYDIALLKLDSPVALTSRIKTIKLPARRNVVGTGDQLTLSGWGKTSDTSAVSNTLNYVPLTSIANKECSDIYGTTHIQSYSVCARGSQTQNACQGDSGGPLVTLKNGEATHVGVVSFVYGGGCAKGQPSGYIRTESFLDWIQQNTGIAV